MSASKNRVPRIVEGRTPLLWLPAGGPCNSRCDGCPGEGGAALAPDRLRALAEAARPAGVVLTGPGEPTLGDDLEARVHAARRGGAARLALITNGRLLAYPRIAAGVSGLGFDAIAVSLWHPTPAVHDRRVRVQGAFAQAVAGVGNLVRGMDSRRASILLRIPGPLDRGAAATMARLGRRLGVDALWYDAGDGAWPGASAGIVVVDRPGFEALLIRDLPRARTREGSVPLREHPSEGAVSMVVRTGCRNACVFCTTRLIQEQNRAPWPLEDLSAFAGPLADARQRGFDALRLVAVEPLEHPDLPDFVGRARELGYRRIEAWTSARALADPDRREALLVAGLTHIDVPILGGDAETHDRVAGVEGSFAETLEGLAAVRRALQVRTHLVVVRQNLGGLEGMVELGRELGLGEPASVLIPGPSLDDLAHYRAFAFPYAAAADALRRVTPGLRAMLEARGFVGQLPPCVVQPVAESHAGPRPVGIRDGRLDEPGAAAKLRIRCTLAARCAAASRCPGHHRGYEELFGGLEPLPGEDR